DRSRAEAGAAGRLRQAGDPRQAQRAQGVHRAPRRGHARDHRLAVGTDHGQPPIRLHGGRQRLSGAASQEGDVMDGKRPAAGARTPSAPEMDKLLEQYGCGPIQFTGTNDALYERHLMFDNVVDVATASLRDRYEAAAHAARDVLSQRWVRTERTYE